MGTKRMGRKRKDESFPWAFCLITFIKRTTGTFVLPAVSVSSLPRSFSFAADIELL